MKSLLATETLKTGETLRIECVTPPNAERAEQIRPFLKHKGPIYGGHIEASFAGECDALETRFYIGLIEEEMVGNIMTVEANGVGILGHVHTREDQRRKGVCQNIMRHQMEDFRRRQGKTLLLGTGYQSAAYWIYHSFGFRDWKIGHPGLMRYVTEDEDAFADRFFAPAPTRIVAAGWKHWPLVALLASLPGPPSLRSLTLDLWEPTLPEWGYSNYMVTYGKNDRAHANVLESETGAVTGIAMLTPDARRRGAPLLDVFAHSQADPGAVSELIGSLPLETGPLHCYADPRDTVKRAALESAGFQRAATLPGQFREGEDWRDVWLYTRTAS